ncbi:MAG: Ku protein [Terriglobales bacterium]|jgi:DNA end-binding protein Ku
MRSVVWTGHLHFGLVVMPVSLFAAARPETTRFKRIHRRKKPVGRALPESLSYFPTDQREATAPGSRYPLSRAQQNDGLESYDSDAASASTEYEYSAVRQVLQSGVTGEEVRPEELVKGYEYGPDQFAIIDPGAIDRAAVETSDTIDLFHFVKADEVDPIYFERSYYVAPEAGGEKAYALLLEAMRKDGYFGIARIGMHKREHMVILRPTENCMVAHTMFYVNEVRKVPEFEVDRSLINERELRVARALMEGYAGVFEPEKFKDIYQERIKNIIHEELSRTPQDTPAAPVRPEAMVPDLMESIRMSLAQIESQKGSRQPKPIRKSAIAASSSKKKKQKVLA